MRQQALDIEFSSLHFNESISATENAVTLPDGSQWFFRQYSNPEEIAKEGLYWEWVNRFFPQLILARRAVYVMKSDEKVLVGSCWKKFFIGEKKLLQASVSRLIDFNVPLVFAVLFFLNQSYLCVNSYFIDLMDNYKIDRFELAGENDEKILCVNNMLIRGVDSNNKELLNFFGREESYSLPHESNKDFVNEYWLGLLHIALMPITGWDAIFSEKQAQLRHYLGKFGVLERLYALSSQELLTHIQLFCRQSAAFNSAAFFEYRHSIIENYCFFLVDLFAEEIKKIAEQFVLKLEKSGSDHALSNMDERAFHLEIIKSSIGKIYLNTQAQLSSEFSLDYFVRCSSILIILINCLSMCSIHSDEVMMLATVFQRASEMAVSTQQMQPIASLNGEFLKIDLNKFSQLRFAQQCVDWLKRTETNGLRDVLLNKNLLIYMYQRAMAQFKGVQSTSYPRFLSAAQPALPEAMEPLYQKIVSENNPEQLCVHIFELMKMTSSDFWNLFLRQLAAVVFSEDVIVTVSGNVMSPESRYYMRSIPTDIQQLLATAKVSPEAIIQLNMHFKEALQVQINESRDSQTSGFRTSGYALFPVITAAASSQPALSTPDQQAAAQPSVWGYIKNSLPWLSK